MGCVTLSCTGGVSYNCFVIVTEFIDNILLNENFVTYGTMLTFCKTCFCTSGSYCLIDYLSVSNNTYSSSFGISAIIT